MALLDCQCPSETFRFGGVSRDVCFRSLGELWDLRRLAAYCREQGRYSFMLTSSPLNVPCLVGSPPNALAIL